MTETTENDYSSEEPFHPSLTRKLMQSSSSSSVAASTTAGGAEGKQKQKRITNEAVVAASEVLRLFVQEAQHRAGIEAECEQEGRVMNEDEDQQQGDNTPVIRADHIAKIAAELLMDFS